MVILYWICSPSLKWMLNIWTFWQMIFWNIRHAMCLTLKIYTYIDDIYSMTLNILMIYIFWQCITGSHGKLGSHSSSAIGRGRARAFQVKKKSYKVEIQIVNTNWKYKVEIQIGKVESLIIQTTLQTTSLFSLCKFLPRDVQKQCSAQIMHENQINFHLLESISCLISCLISPPPPVHPTPHLLSDISTTPEL